MVGVCLMPRLKQHGLVVQRQTREGIIMKKHTKNKNGFVIEVSLRCCDGRGGGGPLNTD